MKYLLIFILFIYNFSWAQSNEKYEIYIIKKSKLENGLIDQKEIYIDSLGFVKNNINKAIIKINPNKTNDQINKFLSNVKIQKFEADKYKHRKLLCSSLPGDNINIYITKLSDLKDITKIKKAYYYYYKFYPFDENYVKDKYEFEMFFEDLELNKLFEKLH